MKLPPRRALENLKKPASHDAAYLMACARIDQIANDKSAPTEQIRQELRTIMDKCGRHLADLLTENVTGDERPSRGLTLREKNPAPRAKTRPGGSS